MLATGYTLVTNYVYSWFSKTVQYIEKNPDQIEARVRALIPDYLEKQFDHHVQGAHLATLLGKTSVDEANAFINNKQVVLQKPEQFLRILNDLINCGNRKNKGEERDAAKDYQMQFISLYLQYRTELMKYQSVTHANVSDALDKLFCSRVTKYLEAQENGSDARIEALLEAPTEDCIAFFYLLRAVLVSCSDRIGSDASASLQKESLLRSECVRLHQENKTYLEAAWKEAGLLSECIPALKFGDNLAKIAAIKIDPSVNQWGFKKEHVLIGIAGLVILGALHSLKILDVTTLPQWLRDKGVNPVSTTLGATVIEG